MGEKFKTVLIVFLIIILLILVVGVGAFIVGQNIKLSDFFNFGGETEQTSMTTDEAIISDLECPECGDCPVITCDGSTEQAQQYVEDTYYVYDINTFKFKYKYPYGWHVREYGVDTGGTNYIAYFEMNTEPFSPIAGSMTYTIWGTEIGAMSPSYTEQWYIDNGAEKLPYTLKVAGAYCYKTLGVQYFEGEMYSCVYDLGRSEKKFFISTMDISEFDEFKVIAESIEKI